MSETLKKELAVIDFTKFDIAQLPELKGKKKEISELIKANPVVEVTDNATYELAKKSRTAVKSLRTSLEKEKKEVNDRIKKNVLEVVANEYDSLIEGVRNYEFDRQVKVDDWEDKKEQERLEKVRLEQERIDGIKKSIGEFREFWEDKISKLTFETIEDDKDLYSVAVVEFDRDGLAEFDVLFTDAVNYIDRIFESRIKTLEEQEEIRITQIELAKEKERQRLENERIAEEQRIEREKFEAEQKAIAEKQRIAQEKFLAEKKEFEEKQAEAKYQERKKFLADEDYWRIYLLTECKEDESIAKLKLLIYSDSQFEDFKSAIVKAKTPINEIEVVVEEVKDSEFKDVVNHESANNHGLSTRLKAGNLQTNTQEVEFEDTWENIYETFENESGYDEFNSTALFVQYLQKNYNVPSPKN